MAVTGAVRERGARFLLGDPARGAPGFHLALAVVFTVVLTERIVAVIWGDEVSAWGIVGLVAFAVVAPLQWWACVRAMRFERARSGAT